MFQCRKCGQCCTLFHNFPEGNKWREEFDSWLNTYCEKIGNGEI